MAYINLNQKVASVTLQIEVDLENGEVACKMYLRDSGKAC